MIDIKFTVDSDGRFDIDIEDGDLAHEVGLDSSLYISLFTDARADETEVLYPENRRGWIGNLVSSVDDRQLGCKLWLIDQRKLTTSTLNKAIDYTQLGLNWLEEDSICSSIIVDGSIVSRYGIALDIDIYSKTGEVSSHYIELWKYTGD